MKKLFCLLYLILLIFACAKQIPEKQEIKFINNAVKEAKVANKLLIIEFWAPECGPCIRLKHDIFENEKSKPFLNNNFVLVKVSPADSVYKALWEHFNLDYQSSVVFLDMNGNEIDRTVSYDGNREAYLNFLQEITEGKNLFSVVFSTYKKDTLNVTNNYVLAKKLLFRYQLKDAISQYNKVLRLDPDNKSGLKPECMYKIAESELMVSGDLSGMKNYVKMDFKNEFVPKAYEYLIGDLIKKKDLNSCISLCEEALKLYPESYEILNKYAWAIYTFNLKEDYPKALAMAQKSISINPNRAGTYSTEAWIHFGLGDKEKAIELQRKAIDLYPYPSYLQDLAVFLAD
jgi:tetratricopeptide (TPR) repeat protein